MPPTQIQQQRQLQIKGLDDTFHCTILALERLERFIDQSSDGVQPLAQTAIETDRDIHDDQKVVPTLEAMHSEMNTQCLALFFHTKFDKNDKRHAEIKRHFVGDLLSWYGGRVGVRKPDDVEKYCLPILAALDRFITSAPEISAIIKQYIIDLGDLSIQPQDVREEAIQEGMEAWLRGQNIVGQRIKIFMKEHGSESDVELTGHTRGSKEEGLFRLLDFYLDVFTESAPAKRLLGVTIQIFPELSQQVVSRLIDHIHGQPR